MTKVSVSILEQVLQTCNDEYKDYMDRFDKLDTKAQNTTAIAGIFLAATFAFINGDVLEKLIGLNEKLIVILVGLAVVFFIVSILCCLYCLKMRRVINPLNAGILAEMAGDLLAAPDAGDSAIREERYVLFLNDQKAIWQEILKSKSLDTESKAAAILYGQIFLTLAIVLVSVILLLILGNLYFW